MLLGLRDSMKKEKHRKGNKMNDKDAALMRSWAEVALRNEGIDHRRDIVARFVMDSVDDPYGDIEVGSVWIAMFEGEERVAVRGETKWYLCETDGYIPQEGEVVELVSKLVPESASEATDKWCREAAEILLDEFADPKPGEAWLIEFEGGYHEAVCWYSPIYAHWAFADIREGLKTIESNEAKALRRLVPEPAPEHPEVLTTEEDYKNAPTGTVVAESKSTPWMKRVDGLWEHIRHLERDDCDMSARSRRVLRWGWEA